MANVNLFTHEHQRRQRWANDGGWTTVLASCPRGDSTADGFRWRASIAEIDTDGPFSVLPGIDRQLVLLEGNGLELSGTDGPRLRIDQRLGGVRFCGSQAMGCHLVDGAVRVFNIMTPASFPPAKVMARPLTGTMMVFAEAGDTWLLHVHGGEMMLSIGAREHHADAGQLMVVDDVPGPTRMRITGAGEAILVRLRTDEASGIDQPSGTAGSGA